jgi:ribosomal protein S15P/S13E
MNHLITVKNVETNKYNPFSATPEELIAQALNEYALINEDTMINNTRADEYCKSYSKRRNNFNEATRLGEMLLKSGIIDKGSLKLVLEIQTKEQKPVGQIFVEQGICTENDIQMLIKKQSSVRQDFEEFNKINHEKENLWRKISRVIRPAYTS